MISFVGVIEHHVQNDFNPGLMQCFHHVPKLIDVRSGCSGNAVSGLRREKPERAVSPEVPERLSVHHTQYIGFIKIANRQKFHCSDSQLLQIRNLFDNCGKCAGILDAVMNSSE